ncbi:MAG: YceI family protein [Mangrovicoccus sp.]|nr:YceI family protein [Mangrovicoccus sp.]
MSFALDVSDANGSERPIQGHLPDWDAQIQFDPGQLEATQITVTIDMTHASAGRASFDQDMRGPDWLNTAAQPQASFTATGAEPVGINHYRSDGILQLNGQSAPVSIDFSLLAAGAAHQVTGQASLDRRDYAIGAQAGPEQASYEVTLAFSFRARMLSPRE